MASTNVTLPFKAYIEGKLMIQVGDLEPEAVSEVTIPVKFGAATVEIGNIEVKEKS